MQQLKDGEAAALLRSLVAKHPDLSAEVETLAASVIGDVAMEDVAQDAEDAVRALDLDDLNSRAPAPIRMVMWSRRRPPGS